MSTPETRALVLDLIDEAVGAGARLTPACAVLGLTARTLRRWRALSGSDSGLVDRRTCTPKVPANRLSPEEQEAILAVCNEPEYRSLPPDPDRAAPGGPGRVHRLGVELLSRAAGA